MERGKATRDTDGGQRQRVFGARASRARPPPRVGAGRPRSMRGRHILLQSFVPLSPADTAWLLVATALVLVMTPALGFFYGGMVRAKNALNTLMMSFAALGFVGMAWALFGYSIAFAGGTDFMFLRNVGLDPKGTIPALLFFAYQG